MRYPIVIHKSKESDYGVTVPDLPGCFSAGTTPDEAIVMACEAILGHIEALIESGYPVPEAQPIEQHRSNPDYADAAFWALVEVDLSHLPGRAKRINISMNERVLDVIDQFAHETGESRSGLLQRAATEYVSRASGRKWKVKDSKTGKVRAGRTSVGGKTVIGPSRRSKRTNKR